MKYILATLKLISFAIVLVTPILAFVSLLDAKSWWALPLLILIFFIPSGWFYLNRKKCPRCNRKCSMTGQSGSKYKQWYCEHCLKTFWTTTFSEDYQ